MSTSVQLVAKSVPELIRADNQLFRTFIYSALPQQLRDPDKLDRYLQSIAAATRRNPELLKCDVRSFGLAAEQLAGLGLEPNGRDAHLIPFKNSKRNCYEVKVFTDYKGIINILYRSGTVSYIHCDAVYSNDDFDELHGTGNTLKHRHKYDDAGSRGRGPLLFYSFVRLANGAESSRSMSKREVDAIRARSSAKDSGPWVTDYDQMGMKTVFRQHSKSLPFTPDERKYIEAEDDAVTFDAVPTAEPEPASPPVSIADRILNQPSFLDPKAGPPEQGTLLPDSASAETIPEEYQDA